ncbi:MAG: hypothetical protein IKI81_06475, partial [Selenomonadaceae bacterium]|nr:hypothetical protein [Selenomonadaceae bacterium]
LDIGAAKDLSGGSGQSSMLVAKKGFSPLEQYASGGNIGPWTDVYALCATIVYCVTGKLLPSPMDRLTGAELDLSSFSPAIAEVLQKGLAIRPEERIRSMSELLATFEDASKPRHGSESEDKSDSALETKHGAVSTSETSTARKKGSARRMFVPIAAVAILLLAGIAYFAMQASRSLSDEAKYAQAEELLSNGEYEQAAEAFVELGDYQDAADRVMEAKYAQAEELLKGKDYAQALTVFQELGEYKSAPEQVESIQSTLYTRAENLVKLEWFDEAATLFESLDGYDNAAAKAKDCRQIAQPEEEGSRWGTASVKKLLGSWSDMKLRLSDRYTYPWILSGLVTDCEDLSVDFALTEHTGDCYGLWMLYLQGEDSTWNPVALFNVEKTNCEMNKTYSFHFNTPQSFRALAVLPSAMKASKTARVKEYSYSETCSFFVPCSTEAVGGVVVPSDPAGFRKGYEELINGHYAMIYLLDHTWENCESFYISMELEWYDYDSAGSSLDVYIREQNGKWIEVGALSIRECIQEVNSFAFHLDKPYSFDAVALRARHAGQFILYSNWCVCPSEDFQ